MASRGILAVIFLISVVVFTLALLPASLIVSSIDRGGQVSFGQASGSVFEITLEDVSIDGNYIGDVVYKPEIMAFINGNAAGNVSFSGHRRQGVRQGVFDFDLLKNNDVLVRDLSAIAPVSARSSIGPLEGALRLTSESITLSLRNGCKAGEFQVTTTAFDAAFEQFSVTPPTVSGKAICNEATIDLSLGGVSDLFRLTVEGSGDVIQNWNNPTFQLIATISPLAGETFDSSTKRILEAADLSETSQGYSLTLNIGPVRN